MNGPCQPEPGVLRIHRDLRFLRDKTPYKTHIAGVIRLGGDRVAEAGHEPCGYEHYARVPKGFAPDHPRAELLKYKGLICPFPAIPARLLYGPELARWLLGHARATAPLVLWSRRHLG